MRTALATTAALAGLLLAGPALAQYSNPGTRAGGIYSATPGNTGMTGTGYGNLPPQTGENAGGSPMLGTGITPGGPNSQSVVGAPNTSVSYGSGLGAAAPTGGMPQPLAVQAPKLPNLKNPQALDQAQDEQSAPAQEERGPNGAVILPRQPQPAIGSNGTPEDYLRLALQDMQARHSAAAQTALEFAETRMLDRSTAYGRPITADQAPPIRQLGEARLALSQGDYGTAQRIVGGLLGGPAQPAAAPAGNPPGGTL